MSDAAKWYVVHTYSGYENKVASSIEKAVENRKLHDLIQAVNIPTEKVVEVKDGKSREVELIAMGVEKREIEVNYAAGDSVRVIDGALAGFIGVVSSVEPDKNKVNVTVSMFGRETPVELELDQVETLDE